MKFYDRKAAYARLSYTMGVVPD